MYDFDLRPIWCLAVFGMIVALLLFFIGVPFLLWAAYTHLHVTIT